ncbi:MAG: hypothetical protein AMXMBFR80_28180 [Dehalococcoidia bacterium]|jgi:hypothetical protein|nr:hypothetical protein [Tepidiformaceae bacterium]
MAQATIESPQASAPDHFHRWRIEEPNGPVSRGVCRVCGAEKQFKNWLQDGDFITNEEHRVASAA